MSLVSIFLVVPLMIVLFGSFGSIGIASPYRRFISNVRFVVC
jgi:hypothetical protein